MRSCMMMFGLVRTIFGRDYRSRGQRKELQRMGYEFVREGVAYLTFDVRNSEQSDCLVNHSNADSD